MGKFKRPLTTSRDIAMASAGFLNQLSSPKYHRARGCKEISLCTYFWDTEMSPVCHRLCHNMAMASSGYTCHCLRTTLFLLVHINHRSYYLFIYTYKLIDNCCGKGKALQTSKESEPPMLLPRDYKLAKSKREG